MDIPTEYAALLGMCVQQRTSFSLESIQRITNSDINNTNVTDAKNTLGIVRYVGNLWEEKDGWKPNSKFGKLSWWIGVEWNDANRGKHVGPKPLVYGFQEKHVPHEHKEYFFIQQGKSASMMRLEGENFEEALEKLQLDVPKSVDEAFQRAYLTVKEEEQVWAGKQVEFVGFDSVQSKLSHIEQLRELDLRACCIDRPGEVVYPRATRLDLARNLICTPECLQGIMAQFPNVEELGVGWMQLDWSKWTGETVSSSVQVLSMVGIVVSNLEYLSSAFPNLRRLSLNQCTGVDALQCFNFRNLTHLDASDCNLKTIPNMELPNLVELNVSRNSLTSLDTQPIQASIVNLSDNQLSWTEYSKMSRMFPRLTNLRCRRNPLDPATILSLQTTTESDARSLLIALLPNTIQELNGSIISERERWNAELWYISRMAKVGTRVNVEEHCRLDQLVNQHLQQDLASWISSLEGEGSSSPTFTIRHGNGETNITCPPTTLFRKVLSLAGLKMRLTTPVFKWRVCVGGQQVSRNDLSKDISRVMNGETLIEICSFD
jgi:Leucine-rich repeat (LRR) protein